VSEKILAPDLRRVLGDLARRVGILERRVNPTAITDSGRDLVFSYAGTLTSATESPPAIVRNSLVLSVLAVAFGTAGTTATTLEVKRDGVVMATVTVPSGSTGYNADVGVAYRPEQQVSLRVATAGTGAADMTATARFT
jgi:hypothetical protein